MTLTDLPPSQIDVRQNTLPLRRLLMARHRLFAIAGYWQDAQLILVVFMPLSFAGIGILWPQHRSTIGAVAVLITLLDVALLDRRYRKAIKRGARGAEHFDTSLFDLPWNGLAAGAQLSAEELERCYQTRLARNGDRDSYDWYPVAAGAAPMPIARIICQRANVSYDSALRRHYAAILLGVVIALSVIIFLFGFARSATLADVVITGLVPPAPILIWALREFFRQTDAAEANDAIQKEAEAILGKVVDGGCGPDLCLAQSVQMQSAIFARRASNPLLFPGLYTRRRKALELEMNAGARHWLAKAGYPADD